MRHDYFIMLHFVQLRVLAHIDTNGHVNSSYSLGYARLELNEGIEYRPGMARHNDEYHFIKGLITLPL